MFHENGGSSAALEAEKEAEDTYNHLVQLPAEEEDIHEKEDMEDILSETSGKDYFDADSEEEKNVESPSGQLMEKIIIIRLRQWIK